MKTFKKTLFGYKPCEVNQEVARISQEQQLEVTRYQEKVDSLKQELQEAESRAAAMEQQLQVLIDREHAIAQVLLTAQKNAYRIEEEARERSQAMLDNAEEELRNKQKELENLRQKIENFKSEFADILDKYKQSLGDLEDLNRQGLCPPTLVVNNK